MLQTTFLALIIMGVRHYRRTADDALRLLNPLRPLPHQPNSQAHTTIRTLQPFDCVPLQAVGGSINITANDRRRIEGKTCFLQPYLFEIATIHMHTHIGRPCQSAISQYAPVCCCLQCPIRPVRRLMAALADLAHHRRRPENSLSWALGGVEFLSVPSVGIDVTERIQQPTNTLSVRGSIPLGAGNAVSLIFSVLSVAFEKKNVAMYDGG